MQLVPEDGVPLSGDLIEGDGMMGAFGDMNLLSLDSHGYSYELEDFLNRVVIRETGGTLIFDSEDPGAGTGVVDTGLNYKITLSYNEIDGVRQFKYDDTPGNDAVLLFTLPENIMVPSLMNGTIKYNGNGGISFDIGEYTIDPDGTIKVTFLEVNNAGVATPGTTFFDHYNNTFFDIELSTEFQQTGGSSTAEIVFNNEITISLLINDKTRMQVGKHGVPYESSVYNSISGMESRLLDKQYSFQRNGGYRVYDDLTRTIRYNIAIKAVGGDISKITLDDVVTLVRNNVVVPPGDYLELVGDVTVSWPDGQTYTATSATISGYNNLSIVLPQALTLHSNEVAIVSYTLRLKDEFYSVPDQFSFIVTNEVTVNGRKTDNTLVTDTDTESVGGSYDFLGKAGWVQEPRVVNGNTVNLIRWQISVGDGYMYMGGKTVIDELVTANHSYFQGLPFSIQRTNRSTGETVYYEVPWGNVLSGDGRSFSYVIPGVRPSGSGEYTYAITFYTQYTGSPDLVATFGNIARIGSVWVRRDIEIGKRSLSIKKSGELLNDSLRWTIEAIIPKEAYGKRVFFADGTTRTGRHWRPFRVLNTEGTYITYYFENNPESMRVTITDLNGNAINQQGSTYDSMVDWKLTLGTEPPTNDNRYDWGAWYLNNDIKTYQDHVSENHAFWPINVDTKVTITYEIPLSARAIASEKTYFTRPGRTLREVLETERWDQIENGVAVWANDVDVSTAGSIFPSIFKRGDWDEDKQAFKYQVVYGKNTAKPLATGVPLREPVFTDTFDTRLEYVPGSCEIIKCHYTALLGGIRATYPAKRVGGADAVVVNGNNIRLDWADIDTSYMHRIGASHSNDTSVPWYMNEGSAYVVTYYLRVKPDAVFNSNDPVFFDNTARITTYNNGVTTTDHTAKARVEYQPVTKEMILGEGNATAQVEISINKGGAKLAPDDGNGQLTVVDEMSSTLAMYLSTLEIYAYENGSWVLKTPVPDNLDVLYGYELDYDTNKITFTLPDETPIKINYKVLIKGAVGQKVDIANTVKVKGYVEFIDSWEQKMVTVSSSASGGGGASKFMLIKQDAEFKTRLDGARFALYGPTEAQGAKRDTAIAEATGINASYTITVKGQTYYYRMYRDVTNGQTTFGENVNEPDIYSGTVYALVELIAPESYYKLDEPKIFSMESVPSGWNPNDVELIVDVIIVGNSTGIRMPDTGGSGALPYTIGGASILFLALSVVLLICRKRREFMPPRS